MPTIPFTPKSAKKLPVYWNSKTRTLGDVLQEIGRRSPKHLSALHDWADETLRLILENESAHRRG